MGEKNITPKSTAFDNARYDYTKDEPIPIITNAELELAKSELVDAYKMDDYFKDYSDDSLKKHANIFYKIQIKHGNIIIED